MRMEEVAGIDADILDASDKITAIIKKLLSKQKKLIEDGKD